MGSKLKPHLTMEPVPVDLDEKVYGTKEYVNKLRRTEGWLSPSGKLYYCNGCGHEYLADLIEEELGGTCDRATATSWARHAGWIKLHYPEGFIISCSALPDPTQRQLDFMFDYAPTIDQDLFAALEARNRNLASSPKRAQWFSDNTECEFYDGD